MVCETLSAYARYTFPFLPTTWTDADIEINVVPMDGP